jgi:hypothetical protein
MAENRGGDREVGDAGGRQRGAADQRGAERQGADAQGGGSKSTAGQNAGKQGARERVAARGAEQRGDDAPDPGTDRARPATDRGGPVGLLTLVCLTCGNHKYFEETPPPAVTCERCGGTVFRNFFTPTERDEATLSQLEETARSIALDEESPDITADELRDLNNP